MSGQESPRQVFRERFDLLYREAGSPPLKRVSTTVAKARETGPDGRVLGAPEQRISDWRKGRNVPSRFELLAAVLRVLIGEARRIRSRPVVPGLYDLADWRARWQQALDSPACGGEARTEDDGSQVPCPYRGLAVYRAEDAAWFFGREQDTAALTGELSRCLDGDGLLILFGASGAGKSSLLRAGLVPALARGTLPGSVKWPVAVLTPTADPTTALVRALAETLLCPPALLRTALETGPGAFAAAVRQHLEDGQKLVLIVDQFEEAFSLVTDTRSLDTFLGALRAVAAPAEEGPMALAVLGLRADFYQHCLGRPELLDSVRRRQLVLPQMTPSQLVRAIRRPAEAAGLEIEEGLLDILVRDLGLQDWTDADGHRTGTLPLLSHVLLSTWQQRAGRRLTLEGYRLTGGLHGSIAQAAERAWASVDPDDHDLARQVLLRLVRVGPDMTDTRRQVTRAELLDSLPAPRSVERLLDSFADARLLTLTTDTVELTHEAILRAWPRLREWIEKDRSGLLIKQHLEQDAVVWDDQDRDPSQLYRGTRLTLAQEWVDENGRRLGLSPQATCFLATSTRVWQAQQRAERARARRLRLLAGGQALLLVLLLAVGSFGFEQYRQAQQSFRQAQQSSRRATAAALMAKYDSIATEQPGLGRLLAASAYAQDPANERAVSALLSATGSLFRGAMPTGQQGQTNIAVDPQSGVLATAGLNGRVSLFEASGRRRLAVLGAGIDGAPASPISPEFTRKPFGGVAQGAPGPITFAPRGHLLAVSTSRRIDEWDLTVPTTPRWIQAITEQADHVNAVAFSPDGRILAAATNDGAVRQWNTASGRQLTAPLQLNSPALGVAYSPDGTMMAACARDSMVRLWHRNDNSDPQLLRGHSSDAIHVAFSPDSRMLVSTSDDHTAVLWDSSTGKPLHTYHSDDSVFDAAFSPDSTLLATASYDHTIELWDPTNGDRVEELTGHTDRAMGVAFSPDGRRLASVAMDGDALLWDVTGAQWLPRPWTGVPAMALSPDGTLLAAGDRNRSVRIWRRHPNARDGQDLQPLRAIQLPPVTGPVWRMAFSADNRTIGIVTDSPQVWLLDALTGRQTPLDNDGTPWARSITFAGRGRVLSTDNFGSTRIWDVRDGHRVALLNGPGTRALAADAQGRFFARPEPATGRLELYGPSGQPLSDTDLPTAEIGLAMRVSPDGTFLAGILNNQTVGVWRITRNAGHQASLTPMTTLTGPSKSLEDLTFSPDGHTLAAGGDDRTIWLWDTRTWRSRATLTGDTGTIDSLAFTPDSAALISSSRDGGIRFWDLDAHDALRRTCQDAGRLSRGQWSQQITGPYVPACEPT